MDHYLDQLIADLRELHDKEPPPVDYRLLHPQYADVPDEIKYVVEWENAPQQSFFNLFGISPDIFPAPEQLSDSQMERLVKAILELWAAWRIFADLIPKQVPVSTVYQVVTDYWRNESIIYISEGSTHLEFCSYHPLDCPWKLEYCSCKEYEEQTNDKYN
jgi:hypothetical protein